MEGPSEAGKGLSSCHTMMVRPSPGGAAILRCRLLRPGSSTSAPDLTLTRRRASPSLRVESSGVP